MSILKAYYTSIKRFFKILGMGVLLRHIQPLLQPQDSEVHSWAGPEPQSVTVSSWALVESLPLGCVGC